jgi:hypothetical protein
MRVEMLVPGVKVRWIMSGGQWSEGGTRRGRLMWEEEEWMG